MVEVACGSRTTVVFHSMVNWDIPHAFEATTLQSFSKFSYDHLGHPSCSVSQGAKQSAQGGLLNAGKVRT